MPGMFQAVFQFPAKAISHCASLLSPCVKLISTCGVRMAELLVLQSTIDGRGCIRASLSSFVSSLDLYFCMWQTYSALQWLPEMDPSQILVLFLMVRYLFCWFASWGFFSLTSHFPVWSWVPPVLFSSPWKLILVSFPHRNISLFLCHTDREREARSHRLRAALPLLPSIITDRSQEQSSGGRNSWWNQQWNKTRLQRRLLPTTTPLLPELSDQYNSPQ